VTAGGAPTTGGGPATEADGFRPDLEGLRAVAVGLVLLYHAGIPGFPGGYVGVDVFFVLSGFLITGLLIRELRRSGRISLPAFYARRARRLLPAAALTLLVTVVASALVLPPLQVGDVAADTVAAGLYASNIRFALQATDYLASELAPSPVLHFWSLGVEEQFYLVWPALLAIVAGPAMAAGRVDAGIRRIGIALAVLGAVSLALGIWLTGVAQPWAFFSLPSRAWELAMGGLLALPVAARILPSAVAPLVGWLGVVLVTASGIVLSEGTAFPGTAALLPTVGAAFVIAAGLGQGAGGTTRPSIPGPTILLSLAPMRYLGRISYSLYLWHWPILVLPATVAGGELPAIVRIGLAAFAISVAAASQRWVEDPIRHGRFVGFRPRRVLALAGALTIVVAGTGIAAGSVTQGGMQPRGPLVGGSIEDVELPSAGPATAGPPASTPPSAGPGASDAPQSPSALPALPASPVPADLAPALARTREDLPVIYANGCHLDPPDIDPGDCAFAETGSSTTIVLFGDSHAAQWFPALVRIAENRGLRLVSLTKSACASVDVAQWIELHKRPYDECTKWRKAAFARIAAERPALVVVSNARRHALEIDGKPEWSTDHEDLWAAGLRRTIDRLREGGSEVLLIGDTVVQAIDPPVCLSAHLDDAAACATPYEEAVAVERLRADRVIAEETGAAFVDPTPWMCVTDPCPTVIGRFLVYRDTHHMTRTFARALARRLEAEFPPGVAGPDGARSLPAPAARLVGRRPG
jgi:peptidoglycan/LPS O-acetylase OafA/YrhL